MDRSYHDSKFRKLIDYLVRVPAVETNSTPSGGIGAGEENGIWWVKFALDLKHPLVWKAVQELGHVLNYVSLDEKLPTVFKPVSPPPYLNGGPNEFLSWLIECPTKEMTPDTVAEWLEGRLPRPVEDEAQWLEDKYST